MGNFTETIEKYTTDLEGINTALEAKEAGTAAKFSEVPDLIRGIQAGGKFKLVVDLGDALMSIRGIDINIKENNSSGAVILNISMSSSQITELHYEFPFDTKADTICISKDTLIINAERSTEVGLKNDYTMTGLQSHKGLYAKGAIVQANEITFYDG